MLTVPTKELQRPPAPPLRIPFDELLAMMRARPDWRWAFWLKQHPRGISELDEFYIEIRWRCPCDRNEVLVTERSFPLDQLRYTRERGGVDALARWIEQTLVRDTDEHIEKHTAKWKRWNIAERAAYGARALRCAARGCRKPLQGEAQLAFLAYEDQIPERPEPFIRVVTPDIIEVWQRTPGRQAPTFPERKVELYCLPCGEIEQFEPARGEAH